MQRRIPQEVSGRVRLVPAHGTAMPETLSGPGDDIQNGARQPWARLCGVHAGQVRPLHRADEAGQRRPHGGLYKRCFESVKGKLKGNTPTKSMKSRLTPVFSRAGGFPVCQPQVIAILDNLQEQHHISYALLWRLPSRENPSYRLVVQKQSPNRS